MKRHAAIAGIGIMALALVAGRSARADDSQSWIHITRRWV